MRHDAALALVALATAVAVASCLAACSAYARPYDRIHYLSPVTSVAGPLLAVGLAIQDGTNLTSAQILFIAALLAIIGPVLTAVTGRLLAQNEGRIPSAEPDRRPRSGRGTG